MRAWRAAVPEPSQLHALVLRYFDITGISRKAATDGSLVAADGLHPSAQMYGEWADLMVDDVAQMLSG